MDESICDNCKNQIIAGNTISEYKACILCQAREIITIRHCSHFKEKKDYKNKSKLSAKESMSCKQPSNHGRKGTLPRKQPRAKCKACGKLYDRKEVHECKPSVRLGS